MATITRRNRKPASLADFVDSLRGVLGLLPTEEAINECRRARRVDSMISTALGAIDTVELGAASDAGVA